MKKSITVNDGPLIARLNENLNKHAAKENSIRDCVPSMEPDAPIPCPTKIFFGEAKLVNDLVEHDAKTEKSSNDEDKQYGYEYVNHPQHYNNYDVEVVEMMRRIWGDEDTAKWCKMTAFKYRMRMGTKPDNDISQDIKKEQWYLNKAKELIKDN